MQAAELFGEVARQPDLLLTLEDVYAGRRRVSRGDDFAEFGSRRETMRALCEQFYEPDTYLARVFAGEPFAAVGDDLPLYLGMLGSRPVAA